MITKIKNSPTAKLSPTAKARENFTEEGCMGFSVSNPTKTYVHSISDLSILLLFNV